MNTEIHVYIWHKNMHMSKFIVPLKGSTLPWLPFLMDGTDFLVDGSAWNYHFFNHEALYCCIQNSFHQNCCQNSTFQFFAGGGWWILMDDAKFTSIHKNFTSIQQSRFFTRFLWMEVTPLWMEVTPKIPFFEHMALYCCILSNFHQDYCPNSTFQCFLQVGRWWMMPNSVLSARISLPNINLALASVFCGWT